MASGAAGARASGVSSATDATPSSCRVRVISRGQDVGGPLHAALAAGHQPVEVGPADQAGAGAEGHGRDDVGAVEDAAVEVHLGPVADRVPRRRAAAPAASGARSSWRPPWLETTTASAPASTTARASSTSWMPLTTSAPGQTPAAHRDVGQRRRPARTRGRPARRPCRPSERSEANSSGSVVSRSTHQRGCTAALATVAQRQRRRDGEPVADVAQPRPGHRGVDGQHQRLVARPPGPARRGRRWPPGPATGRAGTTAGRPGRPRPAPPPTSCPSWTARRGCRSARRPAPPPRSPSVCMSRVNPVGAKTSGSADGAPSSVVDGSTDRDVAQHAAAGTRPARTPPGSGAG